MSALVVVWAEAAAPPAMNAATNAAIVTNARIFTRHLGSWFPGGVGCLRIPVTGHAPTSACPERRSRSHLDAQTGAGVACGAALHARRSRSERRLPRPVGHRLENRDKDLPLRSRIGIVARDDSDRVRALAQAVDVPQVVVVRALAGIGVDRQGARSPSRKTSARPPSGVRSPTRATAAPVKVNLGLGPAPARAHARGLVRVRAPAAPAKPLKRHAASVTATRPTGMPMSHCSRVAAFGSWIRIVTSLGPTCPRPSAPAAAPARASSGRCR